MATALTPAQLSEALGELATWRHADDALVSEREFADFAEAFAFLTRVALVAQRQDHHPDMSISWSRVSLRLRTHSLGAISDLDVRAARTIEDLAGG